MCGKKKFMSRLIGLVVATSLFTRIQATGDCAFTTGVSPAWSNCVQNHFYLSRKDCYKTGCTFSSNANAVKGSYLYKCTSATACEQVNTPGYYINDENEMFTCTKTDGVFSCKKSEVPEKDSDALTVADIGSVYYESTLKFVKDSGAPSATASAEGIKLTDGSHFISYTDNNIFGIVSGKSAIVSTTSTAKSVVLQEQIPACTHTAPTTRGLEAKEDVPVNCLLSANPSSNLAKNKYCINDDDNELYYGTDGAGACTAVESTTTKTILAPKDSDSNYNYNYEANFGFDGSKSGLIYYFDSGWKKLQSLYYLYDNHQDGVNTKEYLY